MIIKESNLLLIVLHKLLVKDSFQILNAGLVTDCSHNEVLVL